MNAKKLLCLDKFGNIRPVNLEEHSGINGKWDISANMFKIPVNGCRDHHSISEG